MADPQQRLTELIPDGLTVLNDIRQYLEDITPERIESARRNLSKSKADDSSTHVGTVDAPVTRKMYSLYRYLDLESELETTKAKLAADETEETAHLERAAVLGIFADLARSIFWAQAKMDLGFHKNANVGVRADWEIVQQREPTRGESFMARLGIVAPEE